MLKYALNNQNSNSLFLATEKSPSNTPLFLNDTLTLSPHSFSTSSPLLLDSQLSNFHLNIHLDYLRVSSSNLTEKSFCLLKTILFSKTDSQNINEPWHPDPRMSKNKRYQQLDNASIHTTKKLKIPENVILLFQPPYCPEVNPIERVWQYIKYRLRSLWFTNLDDVNRI